MKKNKLIVFSVLALLSFSTFISNSEVTSENVNAKAVKTKKHNEKKVFTGITDWGFSRKIVGTHGPIYSNHTLKHKIADLSQYANEPFSYNETIYYKMSNGKTEYFNKIKGNGIVGYANSKYFHSYKAPKKHDHKNTSGNNNEVSNDSNNIIVNDAYKTAYRAEALNKINQLRASVGAEPLTEDPTLDRVADIRVQQNIARGDGSISHYDNNNQVLADIVAGQLGINDSLGENLAASSIDSNDPKENADELTQMYINEGPGDFTNHGHYDNIVNKNYYKIGIGFGVAKQGTDDATMYDAEDFE